MECFVCNRKTDLIKIGDYKYCSSCAEEKFSSIIEELHEEDLAKLRRRVEQGIRTNPFLRKIILKQALLTGAITYDDLII